MMRQQKILAGSDELVSLRIAAAIMRGEDVRLMSPDEDSATRVFKRVKELLDVRLPK